MEKKMNKPSIIANNGFTLIELMIAMAISGFVMAGIYSTFDKQQHSYLVQDEVVAMQQNIRAGMYYMVSDIRMAGFNPDGIIPSPAITAATNVSITFELDDGTNTNTVDLITYSYNAGTRTLDRTVDDGGVVTTNPVAEEIEAVGFAYAYDDDEDGLIDTYDDAAGEEHIIWAVPSGGNWFNLDVDNPAKDGKKDGVIDDNDSPTPGAAVTETLPGTDTGDSVDPAQIKTVRISLLARTGRGDPKYANSFSYIVGDQKISPINDGNPNNDNCRHRLLTTTVLCRNMGGEL